MLQQFLDLIQTLLLRSKIIPCFIRDQSHAVPMRREPSVRIVDAQVQAEFGTRREHSIRLIRALGDQVVDQDRGVSLGAVEDQWWLRLHLQCRIDARHQIPGKQPPRIPMSR